MKNYYHLNQRDRELIFFYLGQGKSYRDIEPLVKKSHQTISREVERNSLKNAKNRRREYFPSVAQRLAEKRRRTAKRGKLDDPLTRKYVISKLGRHWSPEEIAGRLKLKAPHLAVSTESIYQLIYARENKKLRLWEFLRRRHPKRQLFNQRRLKAKNRIPNRVFISERPVGVNKRLEVGHWETDNMEGIKTIPLAVSVNVERKSGLLKMDRLENKKAEEKSQSVINQFYRWPSPLVKTITMDNGLENHDHEETARALDCQTYFCNAYHAWEKGTVENTIGLVREYIPKKTDLSEITKADLNWIAWELNNRPRKRLGFLTPSEVFYKETGWLT
ncbi:IS30 family transposase [Candidatus Gottesmanbacteria bacterium]|nr:IS30 family transposase [Candidatus Gottesmanbacteria bacterium]